MQSNALEESADKSPHNDSLPLFRPEARMTQERFFGQIMLIRPIPFTFWGLFAIGMVLIGLTLILFGIYTETARIHGIWVPPQAIDTRRSASSEFETYIIAADPQAESLWPGAHIMLQGSTSSSPSTQIPVTVLGVSSATESQAALLPISDRDKALRIAITFSSKATAPSLESTLLQAGTGAEVELIVRVGRRQMIRWLFERSRSKGNS